MSAALNKPRAIRQKRNVFGLLVGCGGGDRCNASIGFPINDLESFCSRFTLTDCNEILATLIEAKAVGFTRTLEMEDLDAVHHSASLSVINNVNGRYIVTGMAYCTEWKGWVLGDITDLARTFLIEYLLRGSLSFASTATAVLIASH